MELGPTSKSISGRKVNQAPQKTVSAAIKMRPTSRHTLHTTINPFTLKFKKYILPTFSGEMYYRCGSENLASIEDVMAEFMIISKSYGARGLLYFLISGASL